MDMIDGKQLWAADSTVSKSPVACELTARYRERL
jgi:hypothetical protein